MELVSLLLMVILFGSSLGLIALCRRLARGGGS